MAVAFVATKKRSTRPRTGDATWRSLDDPDPTVFQQRIRAHRDLLVERGGFEEGEAVRAIRSPKPEDKEGVAKWLRSQLKILQMMRPVGAAPILNGNTLSEIVIADLAMTLLQYCEGTPGLHLVYLLGELLHVDRHRAAIAEMPLKRLELAASIAVLTLQGDALSDRALARQMSVSPPTIGHWKRSAGFKEEVERYAESFKQQVGHHVERIRIQNPEISEGDYFDSLSTKTRRTSQRERGRMVSIPSRRRC
jgi:hypothetical protein